MKSFKGTILAGHKECAVEVPFTPPGKPTRLRPGRNGYPVKGTLNGVPFESAIVPRAKRFWLIVDDALLAKAGVGEGDEVEVFL